jgi:hypothetical protein
MRSGKRWNPILHRNRRRQAPLRPYPSSSDYIPYADLTENDVLGWVYNSLIEGDETAAEAKARVEANRTAKVQGQIDRAATTASGTPWAAE